MSSLSIHNNYFLKKAHSKTNIKKNNKNNIPNNRSYILYNNLKKNVLLEGDLNTKISSKLKENKKINNNSLSTNNQESLSSTNRISDSDKINCNLDNNKLYPKLYIKNLENKIQNQARQISHLLEYKNLCEKKIKELNPKENLPLTIDSLNTNYFTNRDNKNLKNSSKVIESYNSINNLKNYEKTIELNLNKTDEKYYKDKYNNLYKKYIKLFNDFKNINNENNNNIEINKLKNNIYKLENEYNNIKEKLNKEKNINEELNIKIKNLEKINEEKNESDNSKKWKEQADIFRKDLVLSQALINSLKSEILILNKKKSENKRSNSFNKKRFNSLDNSNIKSYNNINRNNYNDNNINDIDKNINFKTINNNNSLYNENIFLKETLYNKNMLISNLLEENNKLNNLLKSYGIDIFDNKLIKYNNNNNIINKSNSSIDMNNNNDNNNNMNNNNTNSQNNNNSIEEMRRNLSQYENKLVYFNDYITNIKNQIYKLHQDMIQITTNIENENNKKKDKNDSLLSEESLKEFQNIKDKLNSINIDFYNLDYSNDINCINLYMDLIKIIYEELNKLFLLNKNNDFINKKEIDSLIDLFELSKALMKNDSLKKTLSDILNITLNINKLYKQKYLNNKTNSIEENNNLDKILISQEKELELIKKSLFEISNSRKTYYILNNYNNNLNNFTNQINYKTDNNNFNYTPHFTDNYNNVKNFENNNQLYLRNQNNYYNHNCCKFIKRYSNSRDKIISRPKL